MANSQKTHVFGGNSEIHRNFKQELSNSVSTTAQRMTCQWGTERTVRLTTIGVRQATFWRYDGVPETVTSTVTHQLLISDVTMPQGDTTRVTLLARLRDAEDAGAWSQFHQIYGPVIYRYARRRGLQDADAADLTQDVLRAVSQSIDRFEYDPQRGRFRSWLFTVSRYTLSRFRRTSSREVTGTGDSDNLAKLNQHPDNQDQTQWDREYDQRLFEIAAERVKTRVKPVTWRAFWMTAIDGRDPNEVARELDLSLGGVYVARSRVTAHLRESVQQIGQE